MHTRLHPNATVWAKQFVRYLLVHPEFQNVDGSPWPDDTLVPIEGVATMWIVSHDMRVQVHRRKARAGVKGFLMLGGIRIAEVDIIEIVGLHDPQAQS
jgi:hypothetical protein